MYSVIKTGGKQNRVAADEKLAIEKVAGEAGAEVVFTEVLMLGGEGAEARIGTPAVAGAKVVAEVVEQGRAAKVIAFKKRRRKNSRRKRGHRQHQTVVRIKEIVGA
jgi:large subunit ribosomal protein L21